MVNCNHKICGREDKVWLPSKNIKSGSIEKHPWCVDCGVVKNISDDRPKKIGYWMNILSRISSELGFKQCQKRLISKEIESSEEFNDTYGSFGSEQIIIFESIIKKNSNYKNFDLEKFL